MGKWAKGAWKCKWKATLRRVVSHVLQIKMSGFHLRAINNHNKKNTYTFIPIYVYTINHKLCRSLDIYIYRYTLVNLTILQFLQLNDLYPLSRLTQKLEKLNMSSANKEYPYTIELIKPEDADEVLNMLKTFFFKVRCTSIYPIFIIWVNLINNTHIQINI